MDFKPLFCLRKQVKVLYILTMTTLKMKIVPLCRALAFIYFLFNISHAKTVDSSTAETVAKNYLVLKGQAILAAKEFDVVIENKFKQNITYYIYGFNDGGFIIVSGDDSTLPILGYSLKSKFKKDELPPALIDLLNHYSEQINYAIESKTDNSKNIQQWNKLIDFEGSYSDNTDINFSISSSEVEPLISTKWDQGCYYNALCPPHYYGPCNHVVTGCVATAMAQIMKYWNYPTTGRLYGTYLHPTFGILSANFGATTYNWSEMPNTLSSNNNAVATLMYHCGVSVHMDYSPVGSSASFEWARNSLVNYFKYSSNTQLIYKNNHSDIEWEEILKNQIDKSYPVMYVGRNSNDDLGHVFVCDGYIDEYFHFNWGWGGEDDGYFHLSDLTPYVFQFSYKQGAVIEIEPEFRPSTPTNVVATAQPGSIILSWDANPESDVTSYLVYKGTSITNISLLTSQSVTKTYFQDNNVEFGTTYYYQIASKNSEGALSYLTAILSSSPLSKKIEIINPSISTNINYEVILDWELNTEYWVDHYRIFRMTASNYTKIADVVNGQSSYNDKNLTSGQTYYYKIEAVDINGVDWGISNELSIRIWSPPTSQSFTVTVEEDGYYTFKSSDFVFTDVDGHTFTGVIITKSPNTNVNTIVYNQTNLYNSEVITDFSNLHFSPNLNEFGSPYIKFYYKVIDSSGDTSDVEYSAIIDVIPQNDLPSTFTLQTPVDSSSIVITKTNLLNDYCEFKWSPSDDIDGDQILYNFIGGGVLEFLSTQGLTVPDIKFDYSFIYDNINTESVVSGTWTVEATDGIGSTLAENGEKTIAIDVTQMVAYKFDLDQNYPNPFNSVTSISYDLLNDSKVLLDIFNLNGQHIITLVNEQQGKGAKVVQWQGIDKKGRKVDSGIYFYKLQAGDFTQTRKMVLLK